MHAILSRSACQLCVAARLNILSYRLAAPHACASQGLRTCWLEACLLLTYRAVAVQYRCYIRATRGTPVRACMCMCVCVLQEARPCARACACVCALQEARPCVHVHVHVRVCTCAAPCLICKGCTAIDGQQGHLSNRHTLLQTYTPGQTISVLWHVRSFFVCDLKNGRLLRLFLAPRTHLRL